MTFTLDDAIASYSAACRLPYSILRPVEAPVKRLTQEERDCVRQIKAFVRQRWDQRHVKWLRPHIRAMLASAKQLLRSVKDN